MKTNISRTTERRLIERVPRECFGGTTALRIAVVIWGGVLLTPGSANAHEWKESWNKEITSQSIGGMPTEFKECQGESQDRAWQEFAKALSFTESKWNEKKKDSDGGMNSDGIFSTSKSDVCHRNNQESKGPLDANSSVKCFVSFFKGKKSIGDSRYFGPIKRWKRCDFKAVNGDAIFIAKSVDEIVKKVCRQKSSDNIDWRKTLADRNAKQVDMSGVDVGKAHCGGSSGSQAKPSSNGRGSGEKVSQNSGSGKKYSYSKKASSKKKVAKKKSRYREVAYYDYYSGAR